MYPIHKCIQERKRHIQNQCNKQVLRKDPHIPLITLPAPFRPHPQPESTAGDNDQQEACHERGLLEAHPPKPCVWVRGRVVVSIVLVHGDDGADNGS